MAEAPAVRRGRGRRPADEVRAGVLDAAGRILMSDGLAAVTFDRVAAEAGSSKMTLYKWWPSPGALAAEAYFARSEQVLDFPDTGDLRADLTAQVSAFVGMLVQGGAGRPVAELIGAAQTDPVLAAAWSQHYTKPRRELARTRLQKAQELGQLRAGVDLDVFIDLLWGACYKRLLVPDNEFDASYAATLVDHALFGVVPPA
jgi:AcrR family transcriptional regulator